MKVVKDLRETTEVLDKRIKVLEAHDSPHYRAGMLDQ